MSLAVQGAVTRAAPRSRLARLGDAMRLRRRTIAGIQWAVVLVYALLTRLHPDRQFLHDALCGTRLVTWRPLRPAKSAG